MINAQITMTHPVSLGQPSHSSPRKRQGPVPGGLHGQPRPRPGITAPEPEDTPRKAPGIHLTPEEKREEQLQRKKEQLTQRQKQINKNLTRIHLSNVIRAYALRIAQEDPNDDPNELYRQIRPLLTLMGLSNLINKQKTLLEIGQTQGKDSLYCVLLRRENALPPEIITRIYRNIKQLHSIQWDAQGMKIYIWYPYVAPTDTTTIKPIR
jgi:hypothetical protein